jgi:hypothetical protein
MSVGASGGTTLMNQFQAPLGAVFTAQDIGLDHSNGSSINFESAVLAVGGSGRSCQGCTPRSVEQRADSLSPFASNIQRVFFSLAGYSVGYYTKTLFTDRYTRQGFAISLER